MRNTQYVLISLLALCIVAWKQSDKVKRIGLYQDKLSIEVPASWQYKEKYRKYSDYQIKFDASISHKKTKSIITIDVYDSSHMYNQPINNDLLDSFKEVQLKTKGKSVVFLSREVVRIEDKDVGILKFTFETEGKTCYGIQLFFRISVNDFCEIEVNSLGYPSADFKKIADRIIKSLHFN